jgi:hypothetical protein
LFTQGGGGNAAIVNASQVDLAASDIGGALDITATTGGVVDSGVVLIRGRGSFKSSESGADIVLDTLDSTRLQLTTLGPNGSAYVTNLRSLGLDNVDVGGALSVQVVGGDLVVAGNVLSGDFAIVGQAITLHATGTLEILPGSLISSAIGDGGALSLHNVDFSGEINVGQGDVTLSSDNGMTTRIKTPILNTGSIRITASQDVLIETSIDQTAAGNGIRIIAGTGNGVDGGVQLIGGALNAVGSIGVSGGMFVGPPHHLVGIHVDPGSSIHSALDEVTLDTRAQTNLVESDVQLDGDISGIAVSIDVGRDVLVGANSVVSAGSGGLLATTGRDFTMNDGAQLRADNSLLFVGATRSISVAQLSSSLNGLAVQLTAGQSIVDAGDQDVDILAPNGQLQFNAGSVGVADPLEVQVATLSGIVGSSGISINEADDLLISMLQSDGPVRLDVGGGLALNRLSSNDDIQLTVGGDVVSNSTSGSISALNGLLAMNVVGAVGEAVPIEIDAERLRLDAGGDVAIESIQLNFVEQLEAGGKLDWNTTSTHIVGTVRSGSGFVQIQADDLDIGSMGLIDTGVAGRLHIVPNHGFLVGTSSNPAVFSMSDGEWDHVTSDVVQVFAAEEIIVADNWTLSTVNTLHLQTPATVDSSAGSVAVKQLVIESAGWLAPGNNQIDVLAYTVTGQFWHTNQGDLRISAVDGVHTATYTGGTPQRFVVTGSLQIGMPLLTTSNGVSIWQTSGSISQDQPVVVDALSVLSGDSVDLSLATNDFDLFAVQSTGTVRVQDQDDLTLADFNVAGDFVAADAEWTVGGTLVVDGQVAVANLLRLSTVGDVVGGAGQFMDAATLNAEIGGSFGTAATPLEGSIRSLSVNQSDGFHLLNQGDLTIESLGDAFKSTGDVGIQGTGALMINGSVSVIGDLTLTSAVGFDVTLAQTIQVSNGDLTVTAGKNLHLVHGTSSGVDLNTQGINSLAIFRANGQIDFGNDYVIATDTGMFRLFPLIENATLFVEPQDIGGSHINGSGQAIVRIVVGVPLETNYELEINWFDGTIEVNPMSIGGQTSFDGDTPYFFSHSYLSNPDASDSSAPVPMSATVRWDPRAGGVHGVQFFTGGDFSQQAVTTVARTQTVSGEGIQSFIFTFESELEIVPERRQVTATEATTTASADVKIQESLEGVRQDVESKLVTGRRIYMQAIDELTGKPIGDTVDLSTVELGQIVKSIERAKLPNGRYRVYVQEANSTRSRTLLEVQVDGGEVVPRGFRANSADRQPDSTGKLATPPAENNDDAEEIPDSPDETTDSGKPQVSASGETNSSVRHGSFGPLGLLIASRLRRQRGDAVEGHHCKPQNLVAQYRRVMKLE